MYSDQKSNDSNLNYFSYFNYDTYTLIVLKKNLKKYFDRFIVLNYSNGEIKTDGNAI